MKVTSLQKYKGSTYEVELDYERKIYLHIDIIVDFSVKTGMELDRAELREIIYASNFRRAYQYALYRLDYRDYSAKEMTDKLVQTYKNEALCLVVVEKLKKVGVIDDVRYAEKLARKLVEVKKYGYIRAKRELKLKGVGEFIAVDALEKYSESFGENIMSLLETKHARYLTDKSDRKSVEKVKAALVRYGYGFDEINRSIKEYFENYEADED